MKNSIYSKKFVSHEAVLAIHCISILLLFCPLALFLTLDIFISETVFLAIILMSFLWAYYSSSLVGINWYHPYRLFLLIFFLYNMFGFYYYLVIGDSFFNYPFKEVSRSIYNAYTRQMTFYSIIYFISFVHLGILLYCNTIQYKPDQTFTWVNDKKMEKIGQAIFFIFLLPAAYYYYTVIIEAILLGGYGKYTFADTGGTSNLNFLVRIADNMLTIGFVMYLAAKPETKKMFILSIVYIIPFLLMSISTGSRVHIIVQILMLVTYYSMRGVLGKKTIFVLLVIIVLLAISLTAFRAYNQDFNVFETLNKINYSDDNIVENFFVSQSTSTHLTGMTIAYVDDDKIEYSLKYLFYPLFTSGGYDPNKADKDYYSLADRLSALSLSLFGFGGGFGSNIVAEFYACGGLTAIIILSILWGFCIMMISNPTNNYKVLLFLLLLPGVYYSARAHPLTAIIAAKMNLVLAILIIYLYKYLKQVRLLLFREAQ